MESTFWSGFEKQALDERNDRLHAGLAAGAAAGVGGVSGLSGVTTPREDFKINRSKVQAGLKRKDASISRAASSVVPFGKGLFRDAAAADERHALKHDYLAKAYGRVRRNKRLLGGAGAALLAGAGTYAGMRAIQKERGAGPKGTP